MENQTQETTESTESTPKPESTGELTTQVTSVAAEDEKAGTKTPVPTAEELVSRAVVSMHRSRQGLLNIMGQLSKKATLRVLSSIFELPQDGLPVTLRGNQEKLAFALGQRIQSDRFLIIQHHINKEIQNRKRLEEEKIQETQPSQEATNEQQP